MCASSCLPLSRRCKWRGDCDGLQFSGWHTEKNATESYGLRLWWMAPRHARVRQFMSSSILCDCAVYRAREKDTRRALNSIWATGKCDGNWRAVRCVTLWTIMRVNNITNIGFQNVVNKLTLFFVFEAQLTQLLYKYKLKCIPVINIEPNIYHNYIKCWW